MSTPSITPERVYDEAARCYIIICRACGTPFRVRPQHGRRRFCSDLCYAALHPCKVAKWPRWTHKEIRTLRDLAGTISSKEIARLLGRPYEATKKKAQSIGVSLRRIGEQCPLTRYADAQVEEARRLSDEGMKGKEIAAQIGVSYYTVQDWIQYRTRLGYTPERW